MRTTITSAMKTFTCLLPLKLLIRSETRLAAPLLWSLGCQTYFNPTENIVAYLRRLQHSDPVFNMEVDGMRPAFIFEPEYMVTMLTREECTRRPGTPVVVKGLVWCTDGTRMKEGTRAGVCGQSVGKRLNISLARYATVFRTEILLS